MLRKFCDWLWPERFETVDVERIVVRFITDGGAVDREFIGEAYWSHEWKIPRVWTASELLRRFLADWKETGTKTFGNARVPFHRLRQADVIYKEPVTETLGNAKWKSRQPAPPEITAPRLYCPA